MMMEEAPQFRDTLLYVDGGRSGTVIILDFAEMLLKNETLDGHVQKQFPLLQIEV